MHVMAMTSVTRVSSLSSSSSRRAALTLAMRSTSNTAKFRGMPALPARGASSSRSRAVFLSALATLGASSASTASAFGGTSSFGGSAVGMGMGMGMGGVRLLVTSAASTLAHALTLSLLVTPQAVLCSGRRGEGGDEDGDGKGRDSIKALLRIASDFFLGDGKDDAGSESKSRKKTRQEVDDTENAKRLVRDLVDAFNGFGGDVTKAVDGAVKRKHKPAGDESLGDVVREKINSLVESGAPAQISFGFGMGICCGFAAKKTAKAALVGIGLAFGSLQVLSYMGYVELDYRKIEGEVMTSLDLDKDGKVDTNDLQELWNRTMKVLSYNLPTGSGFVAGALIGARMG